MPSRAATHHRSFLSLRHDQDIPYDGVRREGIQDYLCVLILHDMTSIILDAVPRSGLSVSLLLRL
jgi:hypothetical protein